MKSSQNLFFILSIAIILLLSACVKNEFPKTKNAGDVNKVIELFFSKSGQSLVDGKPPKLDMCLTQDVCSETLQQLFSLGNEPLLEAFTGHIENIDLKFNGDTVSGSFMYVYKITFSENKVKNELIVDLDENDNEVIRSGDKFLNSSAKHDIQLININNEWKITKIHTYSEGDGYQIDNSGSQIIIGDNNELELRSPLYSYSRSSAVSYAKQYTINNNDIDKYPCNGYNSLYQCFKINDCANLVSQSLYKGGVTFKNAYTSVSSASSWWYNNKNTTSTTDDATSNSWSTANGLYNHITSSSRGVVTTNLQSLQVGDLVFTKWVRKNSDGTCYYNSTYDHSMIITSLTKSLLGSITNLNLTYHTNDRVNKPLYGVGGIIQQSSYSCKVSSTFQTVIPIITLVKMNNTAN